MSAPQEIFISISAANGPPAETTPGEAAAFAVTLAAVLLAAALAWRHGRDPHGPGSRRLARSFTAAFFFGVALTLSQAAYDQVMSRFGPTLVERAAQAALATLALLPLLAFADLMLEPLRPGRRRGWLIAAPAGSALLVTAMGLAVAWKLDSIWTMTVLEVLRAFLIAGGSGLIWWSLLPVEDPAVARVFE